MLRVNGYEVMNSAKNDNLPSTTSQEHLTKNVLSKNS